MALSKDFFHCGWNIFDLIIVSASLLDLIFELVDGLSVLRGLRLVSLTTKKYKTDVFPDIFSFFLSSGY